MKLSRRKAIEAALYGTTATTLAGGSVMAAAGSTDTQATESDLTHILRHYVICTENDAAMDAMLQELKDKLDLDSQPKKELTKLGFTTAMVIIGKTVLEVVAPLRPGARPSIDNFVKERNGPGISKLVFQTFDAEALRQRIYALNLKLEVDRQFRESQMITLDREMYGTSLEAFDYTPLDKWWGYDGNKSYPQGSLIDDVAGVTVDIDNPAAVATLVAHIFNARLDNETNTVTFQKNTTVPYDERYMKFRSPVGETLGVLSLDVIARDRSMAGTTVSVTGIDFHLV